MQRLNKGLTEKVKLPDNVEVNIQDDLPERVVQFGEGNFLRGFVDWMIHQLNKKQLFNGKVVAVQPTPHGKVVPKLNAQDGLYTFVLQGVEDGKEVDKYEVISSISRGINPYEQWNEVLRLAESPSVEFVFSNTTEAGLSYMNEDYNPKESPLSFPGKLTAFLYHRYQVMNGDSNAGLTIIPCELVEGNGNLLKKFVLKIAADWKLGDSFADWVNNSNRFCNTLVDRIVPGYPKSNIDSFQKYLGYEDQLIGVGEPFHLFVIEADHTVAANIPFHQAGLNVKWGDVTPYRKLKVSLLNAPHTMMFSIGYLSGLDTVYEVMEDNILSRYVKKSMDEEILPILPFDDKEKNEFAVSVLERFSNPFVKHALEDLGLNAIYKFKTRVLPLFLQWTEEKERIPRCMSFSLAALIKYYKPVKRIDDEHMEGQRRDKPYKIRDSKEAVKTLHEAWEKYDHTQQNTEQLVKTVLGNEALWGMNLCKVKGLKEEICEHLETMIQKGMEQSVKQLIHETTVET